MEAVTSTIPDESDRFVVPLGIDPDGNPIRPALAKKGVPYKCPSCALGLTLKKGEIRAHHFSHRMEKHGDPECNPETRLHKSAKALVMKVISDAIAQVGHKPVIYLKHKYCEAFSEAEVPYGITKAIEEYRLPSGRILDVAIFKGEEVVLGVEIFVTHRVDALKKGLLTCPWIELYAKEVIESPLKWFCLQQGGVFPWCSLCDKIANPPPPPPPKTHLLKLKADISYEPFPPSRDLLAPRIQSSGPHATTSMSEKKVEMCLERLPEVLDCFEPPGDPLKLPGGGIMENPRRSSGELRSIIAQGNMLDIYQKKAILWRISEYLQAAKPWIRGSTLEEKRKNLTLVNDAIGWLTK